MLKVTEQFLLDNKFIPMEVAGGFTLYSLKILPQFRLDIYPNDSTACLVTCLDGRTDHILFDTLDCTQQWVNDLVKTLTGKALPKPAVEIGNVVEATIDDNIYRFIVVDINDRLIWGCELLPGMSTQVHTSNSFCFGHNDYKIINENAGEYFSNVVNS